MKKIIFTLFLGMMANFAFPQSYHKLIRENTYWDEYMVVMPEIWCYTSAKRIFFTNQDTLINGLTYKISKEQIISPLNPGPFCPPLVIDTASNLTYQFLREDTVEKKVYIYTPAYGGTGSDQLFYDFSLLPGDTLQSSYTGMGALLVLDSIVTIVLNNGETRKEFSFTPNYPSAFNYIEGIGGSFGLFDPIPVGFAEWYGGYFCVKENSVNLYGEQCDYGYVGQNEMKTEPVSVFPNPANNFITVVMPRDYEGSDFILFNLRGVQVFRHRLNSGSGTFSVSGLVPGIYNYQIKSNQSIHNGKLAIY